MGETAVRSFSRSFENDVWRPSIATGLLSLMAAKRKTADSSPSPSPSSSGEDVQFLEDLGRPSSSAQQQQQRRPRGRRSKSRKVRQQQAPEQEQKPERVFLVEDESLSADETAPGSAQQPGPRKLTGRAVMRWSSRVRNEFHRPVGLGCPTQSPNQPAVSLEIITKGNLSL